MWGNNIFLFLLFLNFPSNTRCMFQYDTQNTCWHSGGRRRNLFCRISLFNFTYWCWVIALSTVVLICEFCLHRNVSTSAFSPRLYLVGLPDLTGFLQFLNFQQSFLFFNAINITTVVETGVMMLLSILIAVRNKIYFFLNIKVKGKLTP